LKNKVFDLPGSSLTTLIAAMTEVLMLRAYKDKETKLVHYGVDIKSLHHSV